RSQASGALCGNFDDAVRKELHTWAKPDTILLHTCARREPRRMDPTITSIARQAGVSHAPVLFALSPGGFPLAGYFASKCRTRFRVKKAGALALLPLLAGCHSSFPQSLSASSAAAAAQFSDVTDAAGIRFVHRNGALGKKWMPETTGSGCAFLDIDNDG